MGIIIFNLLKKTFLLNFSKEELGEETTETKKCFLCLKRIKIFHDFCPHCHSVDFIFDI
jgi:hypothetical protein